MEWKPVSTSNSLSHRAEGKDDKTIRLIQREDYQRSKYEMSLRDGSNRKHRFRCLKSDITDHCAPGEAEKKSVEKKEI